MNPFLIHDIYDDGFSFVFFVVGIPEAPISPLNDGSHIVKRTPSSHPLAAGKRSVCLVAQ